MDLGHWTYRGNPADAEGNSMFVYLITHVQSGRLYVGKRQFKKTIKRPPLKGKKRRRIDQVIDPSFRTYRSSSKFLQEWIEREGEGAFTFEILSFHPSKSSAAWEELKIQVENDVLRNDQWINQCVHVRLNRLS